MKNEDHVSLTKYSGTIEIKYQFYNNYRNNARSLTNFNCQYADRDINLKFLRRVREREQAILKFVIVKNKLMSVFKAPVLLLTINFVITLSK